MQRIAGHVDEKILPNSPKNGLLGVEFSQIPVRLGFGHSERLSSLPQQPGNGPQFHFGFFSLSKEHADGKRRENHKGTNQIFSPLRTFAKQGFLQRQRNRRQLHMVQPFRFRLTDAVVQMSNSGNLHADLLDWRAFTTR